MLGFLPYNEEIVMFKKGEVDSWGIVQPDMRIEVPCYIKESVASVLHPGANSHIEVITYKVGFEGQFEINVGDYIEIYGQKFAVKRVGYIKDFDRNIIETTVTV